MSVHLILFYLTLILLPTQLGLHAWPNWAFVLGRRIDYLSPTLFLTDITIFLTLCAWIVSEKKLSFPKKHIWILCGSVIAIGLNIFFSVSPIVSLYKWGKIIEFACLGYYIYKTKPAFRYVVIALGAGAAYSSVIAIAQCILQRSVGGALWFLGERSFTDMTSGIARINWCWFTTTHCRELLRPYATFPHPNVLGGFLSITMILIACILPKEKDKRICMWLYGVLGISFIALMVSFSRSAWLTTILATIVYGVFMNRKNKKILFGIGFGLLVCLCFSIPYFLSLTLGSESVDIRYDLASAAIQLFFRHPLFGTGLGTFLIYLPSVVLSRTLFFLQPVHNIFLLWITETGIVGIALMGTITQKYASYIKRHKTPVIVLLPLVLLLFLGFVDHYPISVQQGQLLLTVCIALPFLNFRNS